MICYMLSYDFICFFPLSIWSHVFSFCNFHFCQNNIVFYLFIFLSPKWIYLGGGQWGKFANQCTFVPKGDSTQSQNTSIITGRTDTCPRTRCTQMRHLQGGLPETQKLSLIMRKRSDKPTPRDILWNS